MLFKIEISWRYHHAIKPSVASTWNRLFEKRRYCSFPFAFISFSFLVFLAEQMKQRENKMDILRYFNRPSFTRSTSPFRLSSNHGCTAVHSSPAYHTRLRFIEITPRHAMPRDHYANAKPSLTQIEPKNSQKQSFPSRTLNL